MYGELEDCQEELREISRHNEYLERWTLRLHGGAAGASRRPDAAAADLVACRSQADLKAGAMTL